MQILIRKTGRNQRETYRYPKTLENGKLGYNVLRAGENGVTPEMIQQLHCLDDQEVYNNLKNARPPLSKEQKAEKREWEAEHPGEKYPVVWNVSLEYTFYDDEGGAADKCWIYAETAVEMFEEVSDEVERLREIVATELTELQQEAYRLVGLEDYSYTDAAKEMHISISTARRYYLQAIECIREKF